MNDKTAPTSTSAPSPAPAAQAAKTATHVLVVDDDRDIRGTLRVALEDAGYTVHEAPDGLSAMDLLLTSPSPLVVLLDLMMPRMTGSEILELFANDVVWARRHAFIVLTAAADRSGVAQLQPLLQQLASPLLTKPYDLDALLEAVHAAEQRLVARAANRPRDLGDRSGYVTR
jgi:CheY-like chemotaxis protein